MQLSKEAVAVFMRKPKAFSKRQRFLPGMYVFVNVPTISKFEWHPFTISSAPEDKFISLHIQRSGDWTRALYDNLQQHQASRVEDQGSPVTSPYPTVFLDGPIGAPAQDYSRYREVVLIGAGIGVTPFASILRSIMHQWESYRCPQCGHVRFPPSFQLRKIYFYWVMREQEALTWFTNTMNQLSQMDADNRLEIHNFFSSVKNEEVIALCKRCRTSSTTPRAKTSSPACRPGNARASGVRTGTRSSRGWRRIIDDWSRSRTATESARRSASFSAAPSHWATSSTNSARG